MENKPNRLVLVLFEDELARDAAVNFCDALVQKFWAKCGFDVEWCSLNSLKEHLHATKSTHRATEADLIIFAIQPDGLLPTEVRSWTEEWVRRRGEREGAIVGLLDPVNTGSDRANKYTWVRGVARRAGLDYLTQTPNEIETAYVSMEQSDERVSAVTSVLDEILQRGTSRQVVPSA